MVLSAFLQRTAVVLLLGLSGCPDPVWRCELTVVVSVARPDRQPVSGASVIDVAAGACGVGAQGDCVKMSGEDGRVIFRSRGSESGTGEIRVEKDGVAVASQKYSWVCGESGTTEIPVSIRLTQ